MTVYGSTDYQRKAISARIAAGAGVVALGLALIVVLATCAGPQGTPGAAGGPSPSSGTGQGGAVVLDAGQGGGAGAGSGSPGPSASAPGGSGSGGSGAGGSGAGGSGSGGSGGGSGAGGGSGSGGSGGGAGSGSGSGSGASSGPGSYGDPGGGVTPTAEDCVGYHPASLAVKDAGAVGWLLVDGGHSLALFDTQADAYLGLKMAKHYTRSCFVGRDNQRPDRYRYITRYWKGDSGDSSLMPTNDCLSYNPHNLTVEKYGTAGWRLLDGSHAMLLLDTAGDAERMRLVAAGNSRLCFIGRGNSRPDRQRYIVEYWLD
ncbi:MAG: hypothetical protein ACRDT6_16195 [Micromonosporaceae bacterium]